MKKNQFAVTWDQRRGVRGRRLAQKLGKSSQPSWLWKWGNGRFQIHYLRGDRDQNHAYVWKMRKQRPQENPLSIPGHGAVHSKGTNFKTARQADLDSLRAKPEGAKLPNSLCGKSRVLLERGPGHSFLSQRTYGTKHSLQREKSEAQSCQGTRWHSWKSEASCVLPLWHKMKLHPRHSQVRPQDQKGMTLRFLWLSLETQTIVFSLEIWDSSKFHCLKCRPKYTFPVLINKLI